MADDTRYKDWLKCADSRSRNPYSFIPYSWFKPVSPAIDVPSGAASMTSESMGLKSGSGAELKARQKLGVRPPRAAHAASAAA